MKRLNIILIFTLLFAFAIQVMAQNELKNFMAKKETAYKWSKISEKSTDAANFYNISLTSLTFEGVDWTHNVNVIIPKNMKVTNTALILNSQGDNSGDISKVIDLIANTIQCPIIVIWNVPNSSDKSADANIASTFAKALEKKDYNLCLNLPMAKSVIKAMDFMDEFAPTVNLKIDKYVIFGGSKNGWTSWLAAASGDKRIAGIAPLVFDFLDFQKQLDMQKEYYGDSSSKIIDYTSIGLESLVKTKDGKKLLSVVDPYYYIKDIKIPKLILNATNDSYWTINSANLYWKDLVGEKYILYMPNQDHNTKRGGDSINPMDLLPVFGTIKAFVYKCAADTELANMNWEYKKSKGKVVLNIDLKDNKLAKVNGVTTSPSASVFIARNSTKDFRLIEFVPYPMVKTEKGYSYEIPYSKTDYLAVVARVTLKDPTNGTYMLSTTPFVTEKL